MWYFFTSDPPPAPPLSRVQPKTHRKTMILKHNFSGSLLLLWPLAPHASDRDCACHGDLSAAHVAGLAEQNRVRGEGARGEPRALALFHRRKTPCFYSFIACAPAARVLGGSRVPQSESHC